MKTLNARAFLNSVVILSVAKDLTLRFFGLLPSAKAGSRPQNDAFLRKGITLIELIMAMVILVAISIPTASMIGAQIQGMADSSDLTAAGNAARAQMEKLENTDYGNVTANSTTVSPYELSWGVTETVNGTEAIKNITMSIQRTGTSSVLLTLYNTFCKGVSDGE